MQCGFPRHRPGSPSPIGKSPEFGHLPAPRQTPLFGTVTGEAHPYGPLSRFQNRSLRGEEGRRPRD